MECFNFLELFKGSSIDIDSLSTLQKIEVIEYWLSKEFENIANELPVVNTLNNGVYVRSLSIPAGILVTGKIHQFQHLFMLLSGDSSFMLEDKMIRSNGPSPIFNVSALTKKVVYTHSDCVFMTIHRTDLTDINEIERILVHDSDLSWIENADFYTKRVLEAL